MSNYDDILYRGLWKYVDGAYHIGYRSSAGMVTDCPSEKYEMTACGQIMPTSANRLQIGANSTQICPICNQVEIMRRLAE